MFLDSSARRAALFIVLAGTAACQGTPPKPAAEAPALEPLPPIATENADHYRIMAELSEVRIIVFRGGPLAEYGHNHVLRAAGVEGDVYLHKQFEESGFELTLRPAGFIVDPPDARADEGPDFAAPPSEQAIAATRKNLLGPDVLDAERYPEIRIRSVALTGPAWGPDATVRITLHGVTREITVPLAIGINGPRLVVTGTTALKTSDFGMTPFSALGGGLRVKDEIRIRFRLVGVET